MHITSELQGLLIMFKTVVVSNSVRLVCIVELMYITRLQVMVRDLCPSLVRPLWIWYVPVAGWNSINLVYTIGPAHGMVDIPKRKRKEEDEEEVEEEEEEKAKEEVAEKEYLRGSRK